MKSTYNKLMRDRRCDRNCDRNCDRVPEIIRAAGKQAHIEIMSEAEYRQALLHKLVEEAQEAIERKARSIQQFAKAANYEKDENVIDAILMTWEISCEEVLRI